MIIIGTLLRAAVRFSGAATSISAAAYVNGSLSAVSVTLGTPAPQGTQTMQPLTWVTSGLADGDEIDIRVSGTVSGATETHHVYEEASVLVGSRLATSGYTAPDNASAATAATQATAANSAASAAVTAIGNLPTTAEIATAVANEVIVEQG